MGRKNNKKRTLKVKRTESFVANNDLTPQEFLDRLSSLPNHLRTKENITEARALV